MNLEDSIVLITGGTGSFGNAMIKRLLPTNVKEIRIFSRDEFKQDQMRSIYSDPRIKYFIGNVRDPRSLVHPMSGVNYVFHASALKQVPSCEENVMEAINTNVLGANNVIDSCIENKVLAVVILSTDKACYPINTMGITKALSEKIAISKSLTTNGTRIMVTRYGNVMYSRGSVLPIFIDQARTGTPLTITNELMTRFLMTLTDAVDLVLYAWENGKGSETYVMKSKSIDLRTLADTIIEMYGKNNDIAVIGERKGEKTYEVLISQEEMTISREEDRYFVVDWSKRTPSGKINPYTSENCERFTKDELKNIIIHGSYEKHGSWI